MSADPTTGLPTHAETMVMGDKAHEWDIACAGREAQDGFLIAQWSDDGDVFGCMGHVDREVFIAQWRGGYTNGADPSVLDDVTVTQVEHRYVLVETLEDGEQMHLWAVQDESKPPLYGCAQTRAVTADDPGAVSATVLDL